LSWAQSDEAERSENETEIVEEALAENPGGPEDDSYTNPETLSHRSGYDRQLNAALRERWSQVDFDVFGYIADVNLHLFVKPNEEGDHHAECDNIVYGCLGAFEGSVSAKHSIGIEKKHWLKASRNPEEIKLMRSLKQLMDPGNLLNPGKLFA